jgi:hypothetical protein
MVQEALRCNGRWDLAQELAKKFASAVVETYQRQRDVTENLAPDQPLACGARKFVGWGGGVGPVANLIEYRLGFDVDAPHRRVEWRITRTEKHGLRNLRIGPVAADLVCEGRTGAGDRCQINVASDGDFTLVVLTGKARIEERIRRGSHTITVP